MMIYMHVSNAYTTYHSSGVIVNLKATGIHDVNHQCSPWEVCPHETLQIHPPACLSFFYLASHCFLRLTTPCNIKLTFSLARKGV